MNKKLFAFVFFAIIFMIPFWAHAANFSCDSKPMVLSYGNNYGTKLAVNEIGIYAIDGIQVDVIPMTSSKNPSPSLESPSSEYPGNSSKQKIYIFSSLAPNTTYRVMALNAADDQLIEEISNCQFATSDASSGTVAASTQPVPSISSSDTVGDASPDQSANAPSVPVAHVQVAQAATSVKAASSGNGLIPCDGPDCNFNSVMQLINNIINFFFKTLLLPIFVVMIMYLGFTYLTAGGKPGQHAKLASMAKHMVLGLVLMLCAWLIVHTILSVLGYQDTLGFFGN